MDLEEDRKISQHTVLVVEDNADLNNLMRMVLQNAGYQTESALSGSDALDIARELSNIIMLLDYKLPDMTGREVIERLQAKGKKVPFIIVTGQGDEKVAVDMMKYGARDYVVKDPGLMDMLPHLISRIEIDLSLEKKLAHAQSSIARSQAELSILYRVSTAISQTLEIDRLLGIVLETVTDLEFLHVGKKGGILLVEDDRMHLHSHLGHSDEFIKLHQGIRVGECLCGHAAQTGEIIVSENCNHDIRHTIRYPGMQPHGHIIIPLHARGRVTGVLYLYCTSPPVIDNEKKELLTSIGNQVGIAIENSKLYEDTKRVALCDPLTGLANRRMMDIVLDRNFQRARRLKSPFSAVMIDIDHFKEYNDRHGHAQGDRMLIEIADILQKETRKIDLAIRYGGEEFLVLLTDADAEHALDFAERMRKSVAEREAVTISLGVASFAEWVHSKNILIEKADRALYEAKRKGRNRIEMSA